jgi:hypothetical protein
MPKAFEKKLRWIRFRCSINLLLKQISRVFAAAGVLGILAVLAERLLALSAINSWTLWAFPALMIATILFLWLFNQPSRMQVALLLDQRLKLKERFSTILAMDESKDPFARAACREARRTAQHIIPERYFPVKPPKLCLYAISTWLMVLILFLVLPQKDLLGFLKKKQQQQEHARQVQLTRKEIMETTTTVKLAVKQLGNPDLDSELDRITDMPKGAKPDIAKRQAIRELSDLGDKLKKMQSNIQSGSIELMQQKLKQLRSLPNAFSQKLQLALAQGNFAQASNLLKQFQKQLLEGKLSEQQRKALSEQLQDLARQLQELVKKNEQFEAELEKMGLDKKLAELSEEQLRKALQKQGLSSENIEQLIQKMSASRLACSRCSGIGNAMSICGAGAGGLSGDELDAVTEQLDELDAISQQIMLTQATLDEIGRAINCLGEGMCQGTGRQWSYGSRGGQGKGIGTGPATSRSMGELGETSTKKTRVKGKQGEGAAVASWYIKGAQIRGEAKREFNEVVQVARDSVSEAINENQIPRKYEDAVKSYFGGLDQAAGEEK